MVFSAVNNMHLCWAFKTSSYWTSWVE